MYTIEALKKELFKKITKLNRISDNVEINKIIENLIIEITDAEFSSIWFYDYPILFRTRKDEIKKIFIDKKKGLLYECFAKKESVIYNYLSSQKGYLPEIDNPDNIKIKSKIMIPLIENDTFIGIATAYSSVKKSKRFTDRDLEIFQAITPFIIEFINKMKRNSEASSNNCNYTMKREQDIVSLSQDDNTQHLNENLDKLQENSSDAKEPDAMLEYVSNLVHDIRTPANGLVGFLEILEEKIDDKRLSEYISHARNSAQLINELTTSILDGVSQKIEPTTIEPKTIHTVKYFSGIAEIFSANMSKKSINYNIFIDPLLPKELALDSMKLKRVIMNLISNASKFTPENGSIEFSLRYKQKEKKLHIFVKDSGIGIAKEKQEDIFEAFKQAEDNTQNIYGGTGLGLSICASYVKEMGGKIFIESKPNHGSTFYFNLPIDIKGYAQQFKPIVNTQIGICLLMDKSNFIVANHIARYLVKIGINVDKIAAISQLSQISEDTTHLISFQNKLSGELFVDIKKRGIKSLVVEEKFLSLDESNLDTSILISQYTYFGDTLYQFVNENSIPKVLIVEDDDISIALIKSMLENEYCEIDVAKNGEDGLAFLSYALKKSNPYNIVYTDHNMPILSGEEMLKQYDKLEENSILKKTVRVSITGDDGNKQEYDYNYFATKPFKKEEIVSLFLQTLN